MLTHSSDPLPQIVCPMDEDAIPQNSFCSAPPHSVPPPPLLPLSSITPSCTYDGSSGHRRSGRIQAQTPKKQSNTDIEAAQIPSRQNRSPSKKQRGAVSMVQVPQSEQQRVESTYRREKQNEEQCDLSFATKEQNKQTDQKISQKNPNLSAAERIEKFADSSRLTMDTCGGLSVGHGVENAPVPKGWVIGPLFQSFKSKMASFTEIVMSPVKLFRLPPSTEQPEKTDECELETDGTPDVDLSKQNDAFGERENGNKGAAEMDDVQNTKTVKYSKRLSFNAEPRTQSELNEESLMEQKKSSSANSVPFQQNPLCHFVSEKDSDSLGSSVHVIASPDSVLDMTKSTDDQKGKLPARLKPLPRKCPGNRRKIASKVLVSEVIMETQEEVTDEGPSHVNLFKSVDYKSPPSSSSDVFSLPDQDSSHIDGDNDGEKTDLSQLVRPNIRNSVNENTKKRMLRPALETSLNPETLSSAGSGRAKRERKLDSNSQDFVKRKRLAVQKDPQKEDGVMLMGLRTPRKEVSSVDNDDTTKPAQKGRAVSTRANSKGKSARGMLAAINEEGLNVSEDASHAMLVCSLEKSSGVAEVTQKGSGGKAKTSVVNKRQRTVKYKCEETVDKSMDLQTTLTVAQPKLSEALIRPDIKRLQSPRVLKKKQLKRKSPNQAESDSTPVSTSSLTLPLELTPTDFSASQQEESRNTEPKKPSKRPKKSPRGAVKPSASHEETNKGSHSDCSTTKENQVEKGRSSVDPVYFEMTPSENPSTPLLTQQHAYCYVKLDNIEQSLTKEKDKKSVTVVEEVFPSEAEASLSSSEDVLRPRSFAREVNSRPRRVDKQRRRCRVFHNWTRKGADMTDSVTMEDADLSTRSTESSPSRNLLRSYSCPEIPSLRHHDTSWTSSLHSPHHSRVHTPHHHHTSHSHKSLRRARRHTVCSLEVERELAPLCLRKEVYPARRSVPYDASTQHLSPIIALSPTTSLTALASCFLSSPLAFLSKKEKVAISPSTSSRASSPSSAIHPLSPSTWRLPGFLQRSDPSSAALNTNCSGNPLECELERRGQSEEDDDGEDTSSSSHEFEDAALREEKSLSDSEIKVVQKLEERGKVSSIRIRKTLPKPQNNLTPMGLPKPIRLKKKEFSLEEIYTNKNFNKPPESRLETIFEVPLNRRNGSETWFGQRRLKRFLEFLEVGEARKPKKPLVGLGKAGNSSSRTRRGAFPKEEPTLSVQDVDSLLCAKLDQLSLWLTHDQRDS